MLSRQVLWSHAAAEAREVQAWPDSNMTESQTLGPLSLEGVQPAALPTPNTIWLDPSQAISSPWGQEAEVGSRKSGRSCLVGRGSQEVQGV